MLSIAPEYWPDRVVADRTNLKHFFQGKTYTFNELALLRCDEHLGAQASPEIRAERYFRCQRAIARLGGIFEENPPDLVVIVGNDQMEIFTAEHIPAFAIFWGDYVEGIPRTPEFLAKLPPGIARAELDRTPAEYTRYPCVPGLGRHLIQTATEEGFDLAQMTRLPTGEIGSNAVPHAFGFIYRRVMRDRIPPQVPIFVNTFYPPNQPTVARCFNLGRMLARAVASWLPDRRVAFVASGGLSHFVVDEAFDHAVLDAMTRSDAAALAALPENMFESGTSEIKNWIVVAGAMAEAGLKMDLIDYVPCYRSEAGTGSGMGFACWK
jgi:Catalytic LigB subunit of aromatic ring-opening dioxygenase